MRILMPCRPAAACAALAAVCFAGCSSLSGARDYVDATEQESQAWIRKAGTEGRAGMVKEKANDPLGLRNVFMSEKARDIERNMGIY